MDLKLPGFEQVLFGQHGRGMVNRTAKRRYAHRSQSQSGEAGKVEAGI